MYLVLTGGRARGCLTIIKIAWSLKSSRAAVFRRFSLVRAIDMGGGRAQGLLQHGWSANIPNGCICHVHYGLEMSF